MASVGSSPYADERQQRHAMSGRRRTLEIARWLTTFKPDHGGPVASMAPANRPEQKLAGEKTE